MNKNQERQAEEPRNKTEIPTRYTSVRDYQLNQPYGKGSVNNYLYQPHRQGDKNTQTKAASSVLGQEVSSSTKIRQSRQRVDEGKLGLYQTNGRNDYLSSAGRDNKNKQFSSPSINSNRSEFYSQSPQMNDKNKLQQHPNSLVDSIAQLKRGQERIHQILNVLSKDIQQVKAQQVNVYSITDRFNSQVGFIYNHLNHNIPEYAKYHKETSPLSETDPSKQISFYKQKLQQQINKKKQLSDNYSKLQQALDKIKKESSQNRYQVPDLPKPKIQPTQLIFVSNILRNYGQSFIREKIEIFTGKAIKGSSMVYQMDKFNKNIGNYIEQGPFPYLLLFQTSQNTTFGVFGEGVEVRSSQVLRNQQKSNKFKAFLFNLDKKEVFKNERPNSLNSAVYSDGWVRLGNNEVVIKNNYLSSIKVFAGNVFGQSYFGIRYRELLVGFDAEQVPLKAMQLHIIDFEGSQS